MNSQYRYVDYMVLNRISSSLYQCVDRGYMFSVVVTPHKKLKDKETIAKLKFKTIVHSVYMGAENISKHVL